MVKLATYGSRAEVMHGKAKKTSGGLQKKHLNTKVYIGVYETNFHMILRDIDGLRIVYEIKEWILNEKNTEGFNSFNKPLKRLKDSKFFHISDN